MKIVHRLSQAHTTFIHLLRIAVFIVFAWIGALKAFPYEAEGIVPFAANSPFMNFFYNKEAPEYQQYRNKEGEVVARNVAWHRQNGTYTFSIGLGIAIVIIGFFALSGVLYPKPGLIGGLLVAGMSLVTLSFLITTPEVYVPDLGGPQHGFPFLSGAGRLVVKDVIMLFGGLLIASDSATQIIKAKEAGLARSA